MKSPCLLLLLSAFGLGSPAVSPAGEETPLFSAAPLPEVMQPYDVDGDGKLSVEERQAYDDSLKEVAAQPLQARQLPWDTDGNGSLSPQERQRAMDAIKQKIEAERAARFDELDKDEDGKLSASEFLGVPNLKPQVVTRILEHLDADHDGFISKAEFLAALEAAPAKVTKAPAPVPAMTPVPAVPAKETSPSIPGSPSPDTPTKLATSENSASKSALSLKEIKRKPSVSPAPAMPD